MKRLISLIILGCLALAPASVSAHGASPLNQTAIQAGPYAFEAGFFHWPVRAGQPADLLLTPAGDRYQRRELSIQAWLVPQPGTPGQPIALAVAADPDSANGYALLLRASVEGDWALRLAVSSPEGPGQATLDFPVSGPPLIPLWAGWMVGLLPALGLLIFGLGELRQLAVRRSVDFQLT